MFLDVLRVSPVKNDSSFRRIGGKCRIGADFSLRISANFLRSEAFAEPRSGGALPNLLHWWGAEVRSGLPERYLE